jgi:hypothetical protein
MQLIRCTKKLQKEMGLRKEDLVTTAPEISCLGGWHANLLHIDSRKCVLFEGKRGSGQATLLIFIEMNWKYGLIMAL